jgi:hypothetical protein
MTWPTSENSGPRRSPGATDGNVIDDGKRRDFVIKRLGRVGVDQITLIQRSNHTLPIVHKSS